MKIGLIAMSGVRVENAELNRVGVNLPGFVERSKVIASLPSLSLLTLAGLTPDDVELDYREVRDLEEAGALPEDYDLVAISTFSARVLDAYELAARFRERGIPVVMGGLHVTAVPEEARARGITAVVGEAELTWPQVVEDLRRGQLREEYRPLKGQAFDLADAPMPRFELLDFARYNRIPIQTSRGCPFRCDFCASSITLTPRYTVKPIEKVIAEIRRVRERWDRPFIEFADDNSFVLRPHYRRLLAALAEENIHWFTECDVSVADDEPMLDLMRESGCRQVLIGLESPVAEGLDGVELRRNWKLGRLPDYEAAVRRIQSRGITVNGCFVLGLDGQGPEIFDQVYEFVDRVGLYEVQITVMTAFPGTPLYRRLRQQGRILNDGAWNLCTLFDVNYVPTGMSPETLQQGLIDLASRIYDPEFVRERRQRFFRELKSRRLVARGLAQEDPNHEA